MLLFRGKSGVGKTSFLTNFFPAFLFKQINVQFDKNSFNDNRAYDHDTLLWIYQDINEGVNKNNIFRL